MVTSNQFEAECFQTAAKTRSVAHQPFACIAVTDQFECLYAARHDWRGNAIRKKIGPRALAEQGDHFLAR